MPIDITLAGLSTMRPQKDGTVSISESINSIKTAQFTIYGTKYVPMGGMEMGIYEGAFQRFGGVIDNVVEVREGNNLNGISRYACIAQGWEAWVLKRMIHARVYSGLKAGDVFKDLIATELDFEGFTLGTIEDGLDAADLGTLRYVGVGVGDAFNDLATRCNFSWYVTAGKEINFRAQATLTAGPLTFNPTNKNYFNPQVTHTGENYANTVYYQIGWEQIGTTRATFVGNGTTTMFTLPDISGDPQLVDHIGAILLNSVETKVGILGVDTDAAWLYEVGTNRITQNPYDPVLSTLDTLFVDYYLLGRNVIVAEDLTEIGARAAIEGGSGKHVIFVDDSSNSDQVGALSKANSILDKLAPGRTNGTPGSWPAVYDFSTWSYIDNNTELIPGNIITVDWTLPSTGGPVEAMIQSIETREVQGFNPIGQRGFFVHTIKAVKDTPVSDHRSFLRALGGASDSGKSAVGGGGSVDKYERFVFNIPVARLGVIGPKVTAQRASVTVDGWCITCLDTGSSPVTTSVKIDLLRNGTSVLPGGVRIELGVGAVKARGTAFLATPFTVLWDDDLTLNCTQTGAPSAPGLNLALTVYGRAV